MALSDFLLNTDYQIEKVVAYKEGSFNTATSPTGIVVPHGITSFVPLPYFQWSLTSDFSIPREVTQGPGDLYTSTDPYVSRAFSNTTDFIFDFDNFGADVTVYYRLYGFEPTNSGGGDVPPTSGLSGLYDFTLNTDLNYLKIIDQDRVIVASTQTITHGLGYRPTVMAWEEINDFVYGQVTCPSFNNIIYDSTGFAPPAATRVGTNDITFTRAGTFHYRIYV